MQHKVEVPKAEQRVDEDSSNRLDGHRGGRGGLGFLTGLFDKILESERTFEEWRSLLVSVFKNKGDR